MHRYLVATVIGTMCCILLGVQPALGQNGAETESVSGEGTGTAILRVVTEPEFIDGGNFSFIGVPAGVLVLVSGEPSSLTAHGLAAGIQVSKLSQI
jgi:hypothetical protein